MKKEETETIKERTVFEIGNCTAHCPYFSIYLPGTQYRPWCWKYEKKITSRNFRKVRPSYCKVRRIIVETTGENLVAENKKLKEKIKELEDRIEDAAQDAMDRDLIT